ncbi:FUN14 domain-containing protein 1-like isoform X2 [Mytilus californianus]|uniref:FUN14 domain-containing protein 1-like isoform X2 n=1 Tax=Mytilus californianus TaxID=6549 RepID=UPI0022459A1E|nr:FUN14 domain-containing protein 1-like isoform X2 [Mytilus californianus]
MDNSFEILDLSSLGRNKTWVQKAFGDISKRSAAQQITIGGVSGWVTGFLFIKVTKAVFVTMGLSLILIQVAQHQGYIKINYRAIQSEIKRTKDVINKEANRHYPGVVENAKRFLQKNMFLAGGFAGGFLIGVAF